VVTPPDEAPVPPVCVSNEAGSAPSAPVVPTPAQLFRAFTLLALQGFGGVLPVAQRELVERRQWVARDDFLTMLSLAQVLPGPNVINLALMIGDRFAGTRGALAALAGILAAPLLLVLLLAMAVQQLQHWPFVTGALRGMGVVAAGLVVATALKLGKGLRGNALGSYWSAALVSATTVAVALLQWPLVGVVLGLGGAACGAAWLKGNGGGAADSGA
jgi:chromate transporter